MKKLLSIILAILMIVTTIPFAFAADETPDFSDAKILTVNDEGILCIDGVQVEYDTYKVTSTYFLYYQYLPSGKYKLASDISTLYNTLFHTDAGSNVEIDLNGYTWSSKKFVLYVQGSLSIYDTSAENTGKIISTNENGGILTYNGAREINLYNGTLENNEISVSRDNCVVNLYGGKIKCDTNALICYMEYSSIINIYDTVLETSDGVAHIDASIYNTDVAKAVINVADYSGDGLTIDARIDTAGKIMLLKGIENSEEAEKYTVNYYSEYGTCFLKKTEYNEETGELFAHVETNAFTQQPSAENGYTVDFNNPDATFQWYEAEKIVLTPDNVTAIEEEIFENEKWLHGGWYVEFFTVNVQAGDIITASTTSDCSFDLNVFTEDYSIDEIVRTTGKASVTIESDAEVIVGIFVDVPNETTEFEFELIRTSEMDEIETDKTLQNPECGKTYVCKASVGENVYVSDSVVGHSLVSVAAKAPTCTEIGWDAYEYCTECDYTTYLEKAISDHKDDDNDSLCDYECGTELVVLDGEMFIVNGDVTNTGIYIGPFDAFNDCYKAGDGYITIIGEGNNDTVITLYDATIDVRGTETTKAIRISGEDVEIRFFGENNIFADEEAISNAIGSVDHSNVFVGEENAVLNLYGNISACEVTVESGTINIYGSDEKGEIVAVYIEKQFVVSENAVVNIISGDSGIGLNVGILAQKGIIAEGELNAITLNGTETDDEIIYNLTAIGDVVLGADTYSPYYGMEIPEDMNVEVNFIVPEGASVTVPEGITLDLDSMTNVDIDGELIVYGTLICTHTGGENTCDAPAVCDICGTEYGNIDADNHKDTLVQVDAKAPTCTEIGWDAYEYCTACDYTTYVEKEALNHSFTKYEVTEEAKCGVAGKEVAACDRGCGETDVKAIAALTHKDADGDYKCDNGCGHEFEKPAPEEPTPDTPDEPTDDVCDHLCHKGGFMGFIWKIVKFFWKLFKMNPVCECGAAHY